MLAAASTQNLIKFLKVTFKIRVGGPAVCYEINHRLMLYRGSKNIGVVVQCSIEGVINL